MTNPSCPHHSTNVKHVAALFEEVQNRYVKKLASIDEKHILADDRHKQKLAVYESYVKDLSIQTRLLLQSLDELEKEANQRVTLLENKLKKTHASLQHHHSLSDVTKTVSSIEAEKWKMHHENLDLKHDLDGLTAFINVAKRTGRWDTKKLQLITIPLDRIVGITNEDTNSNVIPLNKELQYRDERIQVLQAEIEHLRKMQTELTKQTSGKHSTFSSFMGGDELKAQNAVLTKKVNDLRANLMEECQKTETFKMDFRLKSNELKDLQQEFALSKQRYDEHVHDLSTKLKTISDRHRESISLLNTDIKTKKQQIEQLTQQIEQWTSERVQFENERIELERQCRVKDKITADLEVEIRNLQRQLTAHSTPILLAQPVEVTVPKSEFEKLDQELHLTRKRLDGMVAELKARDALNGKLEQDLRLLRKSHDEQLEQHVQSSETDAEHLHTEIRALKRICDEKTDELQKRSLELRACQEYLATERSKLSTSEHEQNLLRDTNQHVHNQLENVRRDMFQMQTHNNELETIINQLHDRNHLIESKLLETMTIIDGRNKILLDYEEQMEKLKFELNQKTKDCFDRQNHIQELEQVVMDKTAEVALLSETLETGLVKSHHREKYAEDTANQAQNDIQVLQRELRHVSENLVEFERTNGMLTEQVQQLTAEFKMKQDEFQHVQKSLNKQLAIKQEHLVRYDQNLHDAEIEVKYAKEECLIQEKEIARLNQVQEEQENRLKILQQDLLTLREQKETMTIQYERTETDLRNTKIYREEETKKFGQEIEKLNSEMVALKSNEILLLKNIDELKETLFVVSNERNDMRQTNVNYQNELENLQKMLCDETESGSKSASKVVLLTRQLDEQQKRANDATHQLEDIRMQLKSSMMTVDTLKTELSQARTLAQDHVVKEMELKQNFNRTNAVLDEHVKTLDDRQREIETLNHLLSRLQIDYEKSKNDLSFAHDQIVQLEIGQQTVRQHLNEKTSELTTTTDRLHQIQQDFHAFEKEHRYSNDEYFEREQRMKTLENELSTTMSNYEKLKRDSILLNEDLNKYRYEIEQLEKSDSNHKERLLQAIDEGKIYKRKLALLGECFKIVVRKASETSEQWAALTTHVHEQVSDLNDDANKLRTLDERFDNSTKLITYLRGQHEDLVLQLIALKPVLEKAHLYVKEYKRKWSQTSDDNRHLRMETKRMRNKIEDFHRAEGLMHARIDEQESNLIQLRKELSTEIQTNSNAQETIERLKSASDEVTYERDQLIKSMTNANKKIEKLEDDINGYADENRLLHQSTQKLEKQLVNAHTHNESLQRSCQQNEQSYQDKIGECETLLMSLKDANKETVCMLEQKKVELNLAQIELQKVKYEQSTSMSKLEKFEEMSQELKRHTAMLERSVEEHKRAVRKREKELDQMKNDFEHNVKNASTFSNKCAKQEIELNVLRKENASLSEELKLMRENVQRCQDDQRRLRKDCDQALNFIHDGIPELCANDGNNSERAITLEDQLKRIPCLLQQLTGDRENLKSKNALLIQFVRGLTHDLSDCQSSQKKYKMLRTHSKQQQLLLNQLEAHVQFYESVFKEKGFFPTIEYSTAATALSAATAAAAAPDVVDSNHHHQYYLHHRKN